MTLERKPDYPPEYDWDTEPDFKSEVENALGEADDLRRARSNRQPVNADEVARSQAEATWKLAAAVWQMLVDNLRGEK